MHATTEHPAATHTLILVGASGDLAERLLLPGLATLLEHGGHRVRLIGTSRHEWDDGEWDAILERASESAGLAPGRLRELLVSDAARTSDPSDPDDMRALLDETEGALVLYLALPPAAMTGIAETLRDVGAPDDLHLVLEKPFGEDGDSARALNALLSELAPEERIFRVDHFLGMHTVLGMLGLRFANRLVEPVWRAEHVERVEIVFDEEIALEGRASFYEGTGALVDMLQSHLLHVLAITAMEPPASVSAAPLRDAIAEVLAVTELDGTPADASRRARYGAGDGHPGYLDEDGIDADSTTETLAELRLRVENDRWRGVPFLLRSGKALDTGRTQIAVRLRPAAGVDGLAARELGDTISVDLESGEVALTISLSGDGDPFSLERERAQTPASDPDLLPYGQVLSAVLDGDPMLAVRGDVAERCWDIIAPVREAWQRDDVPMQEYPAGSDGPEDSLLS